MTTVIKDGPLGPLQAAYDAWTEVEEQVRSEKPLSHFLRVMEIQFEEITEHLAAGRRDKAINEAVDILSVTLNLLRWLGCSRAEDIAEAITARAQNRYAGRVQEILDKYQTMYGV